MDEKEFLKSKGNNGSPYGEVIWNFDTASNEFLSDLLKEYGDVVREETRKELTTTTNCAFCGSPDLFKLEHIKCRACGAQFEREC